MSVAGLAAVIFFAIRYERATEGRDAFSVYKLTGFYTLLNGVFGLVYYSLDETSRGRFVYTLDDLGTAAALTTLCWACVTLGYFAVRPRNLERFGRQVFIGRSVRNGRLLAVLVVGWLARLELIATGHYFHVSDDISTVESNAGTFLTNLFGQFPTIVFFAVVAQLGARPLRRSPFAMVLLLVELAWAVPSGARENVIMLLLGVIVVRYYVSGLRMPRAWLAVGLVVGALAFPLIANLREATGTAGLDNAESVTTDALLTGGEPGGNLLASIPEAMLGRFSDSESFATALARGPETLDTLPASRFAQLCAATFVPRGLWPTKPDPNAYGNEFGRVSGMISEEDLLTSINVPLPLQWWMIGGFVGVIVGGLLTGMLLRLVNALLMIRYSGPMGVAVFGALAVSVATLPATILPANAAGLVKVVVVITILGFVLTGKGVGRGQAVGSDVVVA